MAGQSLCCSQVCAGGPVPPEYSDQHLRDVSGGSGIVSVVLRHGCTLSAVARHVISTIVQTAISQPLCVTTLAGRFSQGYTCGLQAHVALAHGGQVGRSQYAYHLDMNHVRFLVEEEGARLKSSCV